MNKKKIIGYTSGVYDMFHIGHLNLLKSAKDECDYLIVAVSTDELVFKYKNKYPIIPLNERKEIIKAIRYVDKVVDQESRDKILAFNKYKFDIMFVGDDWLGDLKFIEVDNYMKNNNALGVKYLPYTKGISSTKLKSVLEKLYKEIEN